jgi:hypothetical protein
MNLLEQILERGYGETVGDINIYKREALTEIDVTHNSSHRLDTYLHTTYRKYSYTSGRCYVSLLRTASFKAYCAI